MKRYTGLFILDTAGKEEAIKDMIDRITADIAAAGAKIETVQKMDKRPFARTADQRKTAGFYVNIIFEAAPSVVSVLRSRFATDADVFRTLFTAAPAPKPVVG